MNRSSEIMLGCVLAFAFVHTLQARTDLSRAERKFLEEAAQHSMADVQAGRMAERKATNPQTKQFGRQIAQDRERSYEEVVRLAKAKSIGLPTQPDNGRKSETAKLEKLSGAEFDRKYADAMVKDHEKDANAFRKMAKNARDPDVKAFAEKTLPDLVGYVQMAQQAASATVATSRH